MSLFYARKSLSKNLLFSQKTRKKISLEELKNMNSSISLNDSDRTENFNNYSTKLIQKFYKPTSINKEINNVNITNLNTNEFNLRTTKGEFSNSCSYDSFILK